MQLTNEITVGKVKTLTGIVDFLLRNDVETISFSTSMLRLLINFWKPELGVFVACGSTVWEPGYLIKLFPRKGFDAFAASCANPCDSRYV